MFWKLVPLKSVREERDAQVIVSDDIAQEQFPLEDWWS